MIPQDEAPKKSTESRDGVTCRSWQGHHEWNAGLSGLNQVCEFLQFANHKNHRSHRYPLPSVLLVHGGDRIEQPMESDHGTWHQADHYSSRFFPYWFIHSAYTCRYNTPIHWSIVIFPMTFQCCVIFCNFEKFQTPPEFHYIQYQLAI